MKDRYKRYHVAGRNVDGCLFLIDEISMVSCSREDLTLLTHEETARVVPFIDESCISPPHLVPQPSGRTSRRCIDLQTRDQARPVQRLAAMFRGARGSMTHTIGYRRDGKEVSARRRASVLRVGVWRLGVLRGCMSFCDVA